MSQPEEFYLKFVNGNMSRWYIPFCPFRIPAATVHQRILIISLIYKSTVELRDILEVAGGSMSEDTANNIKAEIEQQILQIISMKQGIEN